MSARQFAQEATLRLLAHTQPRDDDEIPAAEEALEEFLATPAFVTEWLDDECKDCAEPQSIEAIRDRCEDTLTVPQLVALLFGSHYTDSLRALNELRERFGSAEYNRFALQLRAEEIEKERQ